MNRTIGIVSITLAATLSTACGHQAGSAEQASAIAQASAIQAPTSATSAPGGIVDACALVTLVDAESILGTPAKLSKSGENDKHASHCSYEAVDQSHGFNMVGVEIHTNEDASEARTGLAINRKLYSNDSAGSIYVYEALNGIGDEAFVVSNKVQAGMPPEMQGMLSDQQMLFASKGDKDIHIITSYTGKQRPADSLKALGKKLADDI